MSDLELRTLERKYQESGTEQDLVALLTARSRHEPFPCPQCKRRLVPENFSFDTMSGNETCSWCGTRWYPRAASYHLEKLTAQIRRRARAAESPGISGGLLNGPSAGSGLTAGGGATLAVEGAGLSDNTLRVVGSGNGLAGVDLPSNLIPGNGIRFEHTEHGIRIHQDNTPRIDI